jgi:hypothetical protein
MKYGMVRKCKHCKAVELMPAAKCTDIVEKKGFCSVECLREHAVNKHKESEAKKERKAMREAKERIKTRQEWIRDAQGWFNKWVRLRDADQPCISCGRHHEGQYHAGHYRTTAAAPHLRFDPLNCHKQCAPCNNHLSGNIEKYRQRLIEKIGLDQVEAIEHDNTSHYWTIDELKEIKAKYKTLCKEIESKQ